MSKTRNPTLYLLKRVELLLRSQLDGALEDSGLTAGQYLVLSLIERMPEASSAEVARRVGVTPQTMSETISSFEKNRLIERTQSAEHRRILKISLTAKGRDLLSACNDKVSTLERNFLAPLDATEASNLSDYLRRILNSN